MTRAGRAAAGGLLAALALAPSAARADECIQRDLVSAVPPDGAQGVPLNASLHAYYGISAKHEGEVVLFQRAGEPAEALGAAFDPAEMKLSVFPPASLEPGVDYTVTWPGLKGGNLDDKGHGSTVTFTAGAGNDGTPPGFRGVTSVDWEAGREHDPCTDMNEERYTFRVALDAPQDDGGESSLSVLVFQTRGPALASEAPEQVLATGFPVETREVEVQLPAAQAVGEVCFAALARDLTDRVSASGSRVSCVTTTTTPYFHGCAASPRGGSWRWVGAAIALSQLAVAHARRARRARRAARG